MTAVVDGVFYPARVDGVSLSSEDGRERVDQHLCWILGP